MTCPLGDRQVTLRGSPVFAQGLRPWPVGRAPHGQAAPAFERVCGREPFYLELAESFGQALSKTEVELADRARILRRYLGERAAPERELQLGPLRGACREEAAPGQLRLHQVGGIARA